MRIIYMFQKQYFLGKLPLQSKSLKWKIKQWFLFWMKIEIDDEIGAIFEYECVLFLANTGNDGIIICCGPIEAKVILEDRCRAN